jgi:hypothetical protein
VWIEGSDAVNSIPTTTIAPKTRIGTPACTYCLQQGTPRARGPGGQGIGRKPGAQTLLRTVQPRLFLSSRSGSSSGLGAELTSALMDVSPEWRATYERAAVGTTNGTSLSPEALQTPG